MISVALNPDTEQRLTELAMSRGLSEGDFARELIEACIEDLDDVQMAAGRLEIRRPALTAEQARKALGLGRLSIVGGAEPAAILKIARGHHAGCATRAPRGRVDRSHR